MASQSEVDQMLKKAVVRALGDKNAEIARLKKIVAMQTREIDRLKREVGDA